MQAFKDWFLSGRLSICLQKRRIPYKAGIYTLTAWVIAFGSFAGSRNCTRGASPGFLITKCVAWRAEKDERGALEGEVHNVTGGRVWNLEQESEKVYRIWGLICSADTGISLQSVKNSRLAELDKKKGLLGLAFDTTVNPGCYKVHCPLEIPL